LTRARRRAESNLSVGNQQPEAAMRHPDNSRPIALDKLHEHGHAFQSGRLAGAVVQQSVIG
jgi:hypothetical protein